jgi:hypothetical protein
MSNTEANWNTTNQQTHGTLFFVFVWVLFVLGHREVSDRIIKGTANSALGQEHAGQRERENEGEKERKETP